MFTADMYELQTGRERVKNGIFCRARGLMQTCVREISRVGYQLTCMPHPSAGGKRMMRHISYSIAFCFVAAITAPVVKAEQRADASDYGSQPAIGVAAVVVNRVKGTIENKTININPSNRVFQQEIIETDSNSTTQFLFLDETILTVGPESKVILDEMVFDPNVTTGKVVMNAVKGLFTFVSGSLPSESYEINTPTVSIAVRGTKFDLFVSRKGASTVILRRGAIDVKNRAGGVAKRISKKGLATSVSTRTSNPTPPAPPSPELERLFKPLSDPRELQGKSPGKTNVARESVEEESSRQRKQALLELGVKDESVMTVKMKETDLSVTVREIEGKGGSGLFERGDKPIQDVENLTPTIRPPAGAKKSIKKASASAKKSRRKASTTKKADRKARKQQK